jgi:radical SAM superfamily enzyme YgiQ (UPF0313 family)
MKITLIKPNIGRLEHSLYVDEGRMEPLQLGLLAGLTPGDVECVLYDDRIEAIPYDEPTDLVAITVEIYTARRAYEIAEQYRRRGVPVILGGFHPTLVPDECRRHADAILIGDADGVWHEVVEDARQKRLGPVYRSPPGYPQPHGVVPRRDLYRGKGYLPVTLMQFGRGCRYRCEFCAISVYFGQRHFARRTRDVIAEIERQERKFIFFVDDNFLADHAAAKHLLKALIPLRIRWVSQGSLDMTNDLELMQLMADSGCLGNVIGFESLDARNLRQMKKGPNLSRTDGGKPFAHGWDRYERPIQILRDHHLQTWAAFTLGHDHDTLESIRETSDFAIHHKFCFAAYNILMPYPATPLYRRLQAENRLLYGGRWWLHPEYRFNHAAFVPRNMSAEELTEACWECRRVWNSPASIFWRLWDWKTHLSSPVRLFAYLRYNPIYAREAKKKQGMLFGLFRRHAAAETLTAGPESDRRPHAASEMELVK